MPSFNWNKLIKDAAEEQVLMAVAAIQAACQHDPYPWSTQSMDDAQGKRRQFTITKCRKCGMNNPPARS
jgi:hypothetical protein